MHGRNTLTSAAPHGSEGQSTKCTGHSELLSVAALGISSDEPLCPIFSLARPPWVGKGAPNRPENPLPIQSLPRATPSHKERRRFAVRVPTDDGQQTCVLTASLRQITFHHGRQVAIVAASGDCPHYHPRLVHHLSCPLAFCPASSQETEVPIYHRRGAGS